jgi:dihydrofolate reductase
VARLVAGMTMSLDGYVTDPAGGVERLYSDLGDLRGTDYMNAMIAETGAVLMGRRSFEMADDPDWYADGYEFQVPIFVVTHHPPPVAPKQNDNLVFTFVTDGLESAVGQARATAGEKSVTVVGGVDVIRQLLAAGHVDELRIDVVPVLLGGGRRLFPEGGLEAMRLEPVGVERIGPRTSLRFRVVA